MSSNILTNYAQTIVENTQAIIGHSVIITDNSGIIIGAIDKKRLGTLHASSFSVIKSGLLEGLNEEEAMALGVLEGICLPIRLGRETMGTVAIAGKPHEVTKYGHLVQKEAELFLREKSISDVSRLRESAVSNFMNQIITFDAKDTDSSVIISYAKSLGYNLSNPKIILLVDVCHFSKIAGKIHEEEKYNHEAELRVQTIKLTILGILRNIFGNPQDIVTNLASDKYIVMQDLLYLSPGQIKSFVREQAEMILEDMEKHGYACTVGIGTIVKDIKYLKDSYWSAWRALTIGNKVHKKNDIYDIESLRVEDLFLSMGHNAVKHYIDSTIGDLLNSPFWNSEIETTLREMLQNPFQPGELAKKLGIHRNSLYYRITKIEEYSKLNLKNPDDFLKAKIAFILYDLFCA